MLLLTAAVHLTKRLGEFSPQSVANIAWSYANLGLLSHESIRDFLMAAASKVMMEINSYPTQALNNLLWAIVRLEQGNIVVSVFATSVAVQAKARMHDFRWIDLASILTSFAHAGLQHVPEVYSF